VSAGEVTLYGVVAEFVRPDEITAAARRLRSGGYSRFDAFTPVPLEELDEVVVPRPRIQLALILLAAWIAGAILTYVMQYVAAVIDYPINVGGRPLNSWPAFVPICWEIGALWTVLAGAGALALFCRLPRLHHPIFDAPGFARASQDRFFLELETRDPGCTCRTVERLLGDLPPLWLEELPR
jgi:hypothetical protein